VEPGKVHRRVRAQVIEAPLREGFYFLRRVVLPWNDKVHHLDVHAHVLRHLRGLEHGLQLRLTDLLVKIFAKGFDIDSKCIE
jgi:hypothetical protein